MCEQKERVPRETASFMRRHWHDMPRADIERCLGVSHSCLYKYAHRLGLKVDAGRYNGLRTPDNITAKIEELYPHHKNQDIADMLGISVSRVKAIAQRRSLLKSEVFTKDRYQRASEALRGRKRSVEEVALMKETIRKMRRREQRRVMSGEPQQTKWKIKAVPRKINVRRTNLERNRGYIKTTDPYLMWYDENTIRKTISPKGDEGYMTEKYHLRFEPAPEYKEYLETNKNNDNESLQTDI